MSLKNLIFSALYNARCARAREEAKAMREKDIERWLGERLERLGCLYFKFVSPMNPGVPDRIVILPGGKTVYVELKTEVGRLSNIQKWHIGRMRERGADVRQVRGMNEARAFLKEVEKLCDTSRMNTSDSVNRPS